MHSVGACLELSAVNPLGETKIYPWKSDDVRQTFVDDACDFFTQSNNYLSISFTQMLYTRLEKALV